MSAEIPQGIAIEQIFLVEVTYGPDAAGRRPLFRVEHLTRIAALRAAGTVIEAGGCSDFSASYLLVRAPDEAAVDALIAADVYTRNGVWQRATIRGFGRVCRLDELPVAG